jgi:hypothetical protein
MSSLGDLTARKTSIPNMKSLYLYANRGSSMYALVVLGEPSAASYKARIKSISSNSVLCV